MNIGGSIRNGRRLVVAGACAAFIALAPSAAAQIDLGDLLNPPPPETTVPPPADPGAPPPPPADPGAPPPPPA
ncbi:MAG: hypothetical protein WKF93_03545, partial [Acidimicrobiales bacterium]